MKKNLKKYGLSLGDKIGVALDNLDSKTEYFKTVKFQIIDRFIINLILMNNCKDDINSGFIHNLEIDTNTEELLKSYLIKYKNDVLDYIISVGSFVNTNLYEFYLHYVSYALNEIEKSIFLDGYTNMITKADGKEVSSQKRKKLEKILNIN